MRKKEDSDKTAEDIQRVIMADDGWGENILIPTMLISRFDGSKLIDAVAAGRRQTPPADVLVELAWDIPRAEVVMMDFWMSSGSRETNEFLERFKAVAEGMKNFLQFVPHYHIFSLPADYIVESAGTGLRSFLPIPVPVPVQVSVQGS